MNKHWDRKCSSRCLGSLAHTDRNEFLQCQPTSLLQHSIFTFHKFCKQVTVQTTRPSGRPERFACLTISNLQVRLFKVVVVVQLKNCHSSGREYETSSNYAEGRFPWFFPKSLGDFGTRWSWPTKKNRILQHTFPGVVERWEFVLCQHTQHKILCG
jgi:hypothetical protein